MAPDPSAAPLIILDRDGVINQDSRAFVKSPDEWIALPGSIAAIAALSQAGFRIAVASNQSGLARGLFDEATLESMHTKLRGLVAAAGGRVDFIVVCPHGPDAGRLRSILIPIWATFPLLAIPCVTSRPPPPPALNRCWCARVTAPKLKLC